MPLKSCSDLLFYSECADSEPAPFLVEQFFVGLYQDQSLTEVLSREKNPFVKWAQRSLGRPLKEPSVSFVAGALVQEMNRTLVVRNIGALSGYGPLLYACMLHLARPRQLSGIVPSRDPVKILEKPKAIWHRFATDPVYSKKISLQSISGDHSEPWLNNIFSLNLGEDLIDFEPMRLNTRRFWKFWKSNGIEPTGLNQGARQLAELSVVGRH